MNYEEFLFIKLFELHYSKFLIELTYDGIYEITIKFYKLFSESSFNINTKSLYTCIDNYLTANKDAITTEIHSKCNTIHNS